MNYRHGAGQLPHMIDLTPACQRSSRRVMNVTDEQLTGPTPCEKLRL